MKSEHAFACVVMGLVVTAGGLAGMLQVFVGYG